jgi:hypothetical protein
VTRGGGRPQQQAGSGGHESCGAARGSRGGRGGLVQAHGPWSASVGRPEGIVSFVNYSKNIQMSLN